MHRTRVFAVTLLAALVAAGCVTPPAAEKDGLTTAGRAADLPANWAELAIPYGDGHDHFAIHDHHNLSTPNFKLLGWDPLVAAGLGATAGGYYCGEVATTAEGRRLAVVGSFNSDVAFVVADVTDPAKPVMVGEYMLPNVQVYDVGVTPDGTHVIVGADPSTDRPSTSTGAAAPALPAPAGYTRVQPMFRDACGETRAVGPEQVLPLAPATLLVGIHDPANPSLEDAHPAPILGPHSVSTNLVDNVTYVISSITNLVHPASYFQFFEVASTPAGHRLLPLSIYQAPPSGANAAVINGHVDGSMGKHPVTGQVLAYLANWDAGLIILDMSNPRVPVKIAEWTEFKGGLGFLVGDESGNIHDTMPIEGLWDGRHYVIVGQEIVNRPEDHPTGWIYIIDDTDPANPVEAGRWTLPVDVSWEASLQFSTHYVELVNRTMFVTLYHGGVWAVDLSTPEKIANPPTIGAFVPDKVSPQPPNGGGRPGEGIPNVLDVLAFPDGTLVVYDDTSGVYLLRFDETDPAPAPEPWVIP